MTDIMNELFGPLGKEWCIYFYVLSIFFFASFIISAGFMLYKIAKNPKDLSVMFFFNSVFVLLYTLIPYYVNRLLYTMCMYSLR